MTTQQKSERTPENVFKELGFNDQQQIARISQSPTLMKQLQQHLDTKFNGNNADVHVGDFGFSAFRYGQDGSDYGDIYLASRDRDSNVETNPNERLATLIHELGHAYYLEATANTDMDLNPNLSMKEFTQNALYAEGLAEYFKNKVYSELDSKTRQELGLNISPNYDPNKSVEENAKQLAKEQAEKITDTPQRLPYKYQYPYEWLKKKGYV